MKTDIQISQENKMEEIKKIADKLKIEKDLKMANKELKKRVSVKQIFKSLKRTKWRKSVRLPTN